MNRYCRASCCNNDRNCLLDDCLLDRCAWCGILTNLSIVQFAHRGKPWFFCRDHIHMASDIGEKEFRKQIANRVFAWSIIISIIFGMSWRMA